VVEADLDPGLVEEPLRGARIRLVLEGDLERQRALVAAVHGERPRGPGRLDLEDHPERAPSDLVDHAVITDVEPLEIEPQLLAAGELQRSEGPVALLGLHPRRGHLGALSLHVLGEADVDVEVS